MKKIVLLLLLLVSGAVFSQGTNSGLWLYGKDVGYSDDTAVIEKEGIVGVANCYVRDVPSTSGKLVDSLQLGKRVMVKKLTQKTQKIKGIDMNWVEIQYLSGTTTKKGYLWLGFLALDFKTTNTLSFLTVLERVSAKKEEDYIAQEYILGIKVLDQNNTLLDSKEIRKNIVESHFHQQSLMGNYGLQNIQNIYRISFSGEACGIPTYFFYFGWTGKKLLELPEKMSVADAGVYYHGETFIFPTEPGGKPGHIFKITEEAEEQESANENESVMEEQVWKETYTWDGEKATFVKKNLLRKGLIKQ
ncbi:hypothetical protein [Flavobacterium sp. CAU 1735]|uniref:hypothetical protein n=1 Tax=Flavobacterium sp. CAU 1735 TaxID=3140361 RepID=UPI00326176A0